MIDIFKNQIKISVQRSSDMPLILQSDRKPNTDMKTKMKIAVFAVLLLLMCGCGQERNNSCAPKTRLSLVQPYRNIYGRPCQMLRFDKEKKEDERDTAMKTVADQWNRNLYMMRPLIDVCRQDLSCHPAEHTEASLDVAEGGFVAR